MTPEERLEQRMEELAEAQLQTSNRVSEFVFQAQRLFNRLGDKAESNEARIERLDRQAQQTLDAIRDMQAEVRGLQVENQRILRHLFGEES